MKKNTFILILFVASLGFISSSVIHNDDTHSPLKSMGGPPYNTNAPGEKTCSGTEGTSPCHSGGIADNTGPATCSIISSGGTQYVPGQTYTITPTITHATRMRFGFQLTVRRISNNSNTGNITSLDTNLTWTQFPGYGSCQTCEFIMHKKPATYFSTTTGQWNFTWTAPSSNIGNIRLYACFNASDNSNDETGDEIYYTTLTLTPSALGINEQDEFSSSIGIFPNPSRGEFSISIEEVTTTKEFIIYNVQGKQVEKITSSSLSTEINLTKQPQGLYFIKISCDKKNAFKKIIIE